MQAVQREVHRWLWVVVALVVAVGLVVAYVGHVGAPRYERLPVERPPGGLGSTEPGNVEPGR